MGDDTINLKIKGGTCKYPSLQFLIPMAYRLKGGHNYTPKLLFAVVVLTRQLTKCNFKKVNETDTYKVKIRNPTPANEQLHICDVTLGTVGTNVMCGVNKFNVTYISNVS